MSIAHDMDQAWEVAAVVVDEAQTALEKHGRFHSPHEGYAVLKEEVDELWDAIKANDAAHALREAIQVAAMAINFVISFEHHSEDAIGCRVCGCTEDRACMTKTGPCHWVEPDLCSACADKPAKEKWQEVIDHILSATTQVILKTPSRGIEIVTVGRAIELQLKHPTVDRKLTREALATVDLGLVRHNSYHLAIPCSNPKVDEIFDGTNYDFGTWLYELKKAPEHIVPRGLPKRVSTVKINRQAMHCLLVDLVAYSNFTTPHHGEAQS